MLHRLSSCALAVLSVVCLLGADPEVDPAELYRIAPTEPTNAPATFAVKSGFKVELVAAEPLLRDPIELAYDENGRLFVVEMIDYSELRGERPHLGRIRVLDDTDDDGRYDRSTVFADDLPWPTGVFCWDGGVFVAATPDIYYLKDTDGDDRADERKVVFTGFSSDFAPYATNQLNVQAMLNSFRWGPDNRIHGLTSLNGGEVRSAVDTNLPPVNLRGRDFAFDPRSLRLEPQAGGGQYGMSFDDAGNRFTCNNSDHVRVFMYPPRAAASSPGIAMPAALQSIAADGPAAEVFRRSPDEPWRVIRTRWRATGMVPGLIEGGGRPSGYFTSATGLMIYRGDAWGEEYVGDVFTADCGSNLVHRKKVRRSGVAFVAERPADEAGIEFLASTDIWFRPVQMANAPDGTLHVIDMYREIIEHPWSLPPTLKKHLDLNAGNDRGRIYRIVPDGFKSRPQPKLGRASTEELVQTLAHPNAWHRETAARLLYQRQDRAQAVPALQRLLREAPVARGRMHALLALDGQGALAEDDLLRGLRDADERVRLHAARLAESRLTDPGAPASTTLKVALLGLMADPSPSVRYQLAWTLAVLDHPARVSTLVFLARQDVDDRWIRSAVLNSAGEEAADLFVYLDKLWGADPTPGASQDEMLQQLARAIGARNRPDEVMAVAQAAASAANPGLGMSLVHALSEGLPRGGAGVPRERLAAVFARAAGLSVDRGADEVVRVRAIQLLGQTSFPESGDTLFGLLHPAEPQTVQLAAVASLGRFGDAPISEPLMSRWATLTPRVRDAALTVLLGRPDRAAALLRAVEKGMVRQAELSSTQIQFLTGHRVTEVRDLAGRVLATGRKSERQEVVNAFQPALQLKGDPSRGRTLFVERCASCHRLGGEGFAVGPDLVSVRNSGREKWLVSVLDPNRELLPQFVAYEVETGDDESLQGILAEETATRITLRQAYAKDTVLARADIVSLRSSGRSIMPDELEAGLDSQAMADLMEFVFTAEEPKR